VKFVKRPEMVDAVQFTGSNRAEVCAVAVDWREYRDDKDGYLTLYLGGCVLTLREGDWLLRDVTGSLQTCRDELFQLLYEATS
jgi:hypothetical protein